VPIAPRLVAELNANLPGAVRRGDAPLASASGERLATGFAALDVVLGGGLPRGQLSELVGVRSTGLTSVVHRLLGHVTGQGRVAAWVDAPDAFDPASAVAAGIDLDRLLWIRPPDLTIAFTAAEALLGMGGFPLVLLDASASPYRPRDAQVASYTTSSRAGRGPRGARRPPQVADALHVWMRLSRAAARSRSALVVLRRTTRRPPARLHGAQAAEATAGFSAALRLELEPLRVVWDRTAAPSLLDGLVVRIVVARNRGGRSNPGPIVLEIV
jgi:RecA/RadA recombinase